MANKVTFPSNADDKDKLTRQLEELDMSLNDTERLLLNLARLAKSMAKKALDHTDYIFDIDVKRQWQIGFNNDRFLKRWFGEVKSSGKAKNVRNRLEKLYKRTEKGITMNVKPNNDKESNARNYGWVFTPRGMQVFPKLFERFEDKNDKMAATLLHELMHVWFQDKKIKGQKVNEGSIALKLALHNPGEARRSPDNYEHYCLIVWRDG
ncbi:hypothetical protein C5O00_11410 [Pukyongia salina]|uniref:SprT-like domain-containing protein n=1 Tax=Pukyongia salina TaxID=2094025 RepID=A0A2S0HYJ6_9FLAO|nr:M35 family metallo-endopeptidase [Pukyongia salina]AVI51739.1 hypothetical protein C5O00_11410 [Pukyongia salina]